MATAPSKLRRRSPGREGREGKDRPARAKREAPRSKAFFPQGFPKAFSFRFFGVCFCKRGEVAIRILSFLPEAVRGL